MNQITNRQAISDSRGSASLAPFAKQFPEQFIELGIAEQNLVTVSAGLAACGKKVFAASPASFLTTRSYEQAKVDVAYSDTNVTLIGISGGVSYGALGMTHHSCQDIAAFAALPGMRVYLPSDRFQTKKLIESLLADKKPAYIRVSRSATEDVYDETIDFILDRANVLGIGKDVTIITCGELVPFALKAAEQLRADGIDTGVIDMYCIKPLDEAAVLKAALLSKLIVTAEEHSPYGGLGSMVSQLICRKHPMRVITLSLPDGHMVEGTNREIFQYYGLDAEGMTRRIREAFASEAAV